jgi:hypothetical protein
MFLIASQRPPPEPDLEQWAWMYARWPGAITKASDMLKDSEFLHFVAKADAPSARVQIQDFLRGMSSSGGPKIQHSLRSDIVQATAMPRLSSVRSRWVSSIVEHGIAEPGLWDLHCQMRTLARVYAHDDSTLEAFLDSVWKQMLTQSACFWTSPLGRPTERRHSSVWLRHSSAASSWDRRR